MADEAFSKMSSTELHSLISTPYHQLRLFNITQISVARMPLCMLLPLYRITLSLNSYLNFRTDIPPWSLHGLPSLFQNTLTYYCIGEPEPSNTATHKLFLWWDSTSVYQLTKERFELGYELNSTPSLQAFQIGWYQCHLFVHAFMYSFYFIEVVFELYS